MLALGLAACASDADVARMEARIAELEQQVAQPVSAPIAPTTAPAPSPTSTAVPSPTPAPSTTPTEDDKLRDALRGHIPAVEELMVVYQYFFADSARMAGELALESPPGESDSDSATRSQRNNVIWATREALGTGIGFTWDTDWRALPRLPKLRDVVDHALDLYELHTEDMFDAMFLELQWSNTQAYAAWADRKGERDETLEQLRRDFLSAHQDLLLFIGD